MPEVLTGYYIDENDLHTYINQTELTNLTETISGEDKTNVQKVIINRCKYADTKLANRYEVPFASGSSYITDALKAAISHLVLFDLLVFYQNVGDNVKSIREKNYNEAIKFLDAIRDGKQDLITELDSDSEKVDRYEFKSTRRIEGTFH